ncbi:MAG: M18 family aminopeptidase [Candidatus Syntrophosphaera sp.]
MNKHIKDLLCFLDGSPTSVQASEQILARLAGKGFTLLDEGRKWNLKPGGKYFIRRDTSVIAFIAGSAAPDKTGFNLAAAHIDSPGLKLKLESLKNDGGICRVAVEVYGGPILHTWTDRELGIAGRVVIRNGKKTEVVPVDLKKPVAVIPNVAIHLNREANKGFEYDKQKHLQAMVNTREGSVNPLLSALAKELGVPQKQIAEAELFLYDFARATLAGLDDSLVISGRLDNLAMSHALLSAMLEAGKPRATCLAVLYDHEEIGSHTRQGAASSLLQETLERISLSLKLSREEHIRALRNSFLISADMAHAFHPSYPEKYDPSYAPAVNGGPVIKWQAAYKYASTAESSRRFSSLCEEAGVKPQKFMMHSNLLCGSTVGPIVSTQLGIPVVDVGNPLWAMHSVRETAGVEDHMAMIKVLKKYYI